MTGEETPFHLAITLTAGRQLTELLPGAVAVAAYGCIVGPLLDSPHRVGERLRPQLDDRHSARRAPTGSSTQLTTTSGP